VAWTSEGAKKGWATRRANNPKLECPPPATRHRDADPDYERFKQEAWQKFLAENGRRE
jgi:hypothetical protein